MSSTLRLRCLDGGREYSIEDGLLLGRDPSRDIVLDPSEVSRKHARIRETEVTPGDVITFGKLRTVFDVVE